MHNNVWDFIVCSLSVTESICRQQKTTINVIIEGDDMCSMNAPENSAGFTIEELSDIVAPIAIRYGIIRVWLFGSRARGDDNRNSDYDFCIEAPEGMSLFKMCGFFMDLKEALSSEIDVVSNSAIKGTFADHVINDRRLVYECQ